MKMQQPRKNPSKNGLYEHHYNYTPIGFFLAEQGGRKSIVIIIVITMF